MTKSDKCLSETSLIFYSPYLFLYHFSAVISSATFEQEGSGFKPAGRLWGLFVWNLHVLPIPAWVSSMYSGSFQKHAD